MCKWQLEEGTIVKERLHNVANAPPTACMLSQSCWLAPCMHATRYANTRNPRMSGNLQFQ